MSAEILREAAKTARDEWAGEASGAFKKAARVHLAVADWMDRIAWAWEIAPDTRGRVGGEEALTVALAYLGRDA